jgi:hypothetical protein
MLVVVIAPLVTVKQVDPKQSCPEDSNAPVLSITFVAWTNVDCANADPAQSSANSRNSFFM